MLQRIGMVQERWFTKGIMQHNKTTRPCSLVSPIVAKSCKCGAPKARQHRVSLDGWVLAFAVALIHMGRKPGDDIILESSKWCDSLDSRTPIHSSRDYGAGKMSCICQNRCSCCQCRQDVSGHWSRSSPVVVVWNHGGRASVNGRNTGRQLAA